MDLLLCKKNKISQYKLSKSFKAETKPPLSKYKNLHPKSDALEVNFN